MKIEAKNAKHSLKTGGLLFTEAEITALNKLAEECGYPRIDATTLPSYEVP